MKFRKYQKWNTLLLAGALAAGMAVPAFAAEATEETEEPAQEAPKAEPMTLEQIQQEVLRKNRLKTTMQLNLDKVAAGMSAIEDGLKDIKESQDDAAHARRKASQAASQGQAGLGQIESNLGSLGAAGQLIGGMTQIESGLLSGSVKTASAMEDMVDTIADQQRDTLEDQQKELKNTKMDLNKTKEDWDNEALAVTQLLVTKTVQVEDGISLLQQKQELLERVCRIEEKKADLGFSTNVDLSGKQLEVSEGAKDLQDAQDGLVLLKRQLNDLMGRELDAELNITPPQLTRTIETAPEYNEELLKTATEKSYKLKTLRRDKQQAERDSNDMSKYDGQLKASRLDMDLADVAMEGEKANIANDLKKKLDRINAAAATYQNKKDACQKARTEWEQQQASAKLGLLSAVELQALELQYEQTELALEAAAYDYDLAWKEYQMMMDGTTLDIYETYKAQIG